jgi:hypothetical protein
LPLNPQFAGSNSDDDDEFLRTIKNCSITSFREEAKPTAPSHKILWHVKHPYSMKEILVDITHGYLTKL